MDGEVEIDIGQDSTTDKKGSEQIKMDFSNQKVTDSDLNALREQIKKKDEENAALSNQLTEAQKSRQTANSRLGDEIGNRFNAETIAIENSILAATSELDNLEKQQAALQEEGKFSEASKLNRAIASAALKIEKGEDQKKILENNKQRLQNEAEAQKNDPMAAYSPGARNWINSHPKFMSDASYKNKALAAHYQMESEGITEAANPSEYFKRLTDAVEPKQEVVVSDDDNQQDQKTTTQRQVRTNLRTSSGIPVIRQSNGGNPNSGGARRIQLTAEQAEAALISRPDLPKEEAYKRYFDNMNRAIADGKIIRSN